MPVDEKEAVRFAVRSNIAALERMKSQPPGGGQRMIREALETAHAVLQATSLGPLLEVAVTAAREVPRV